MRIEVIQAWPRRHEVLLLELPAGATVADALAAGNLHPSMVDGYAVYGERATADTTLRDGDRVELLRPLLMDPKEARRRRALKPTR